MITPSWLVELIQGERERQIETSRRARIASRIGARCNPSFFTRVARSLRGTPAAC